MDNPIPYRYNGPNMEQALQREKYSSQSMSLNTKKSKNRQKPNYNNSNNNNNYRNHEDISEIREESNLGEGDKLSEDILGISKDFTEQMMSLKEFVKLYTPGEYGFKKYVKKACKTSIIDILKSQPFADILSTKKKDDMYSEGHTISQSIFSKNVFVLNLNLHFLKNY